LDAAAKSPVAMARVDLAGTIEQVNPAFESLVLKAAWRLEGRPLADVWEVDASFADAGLLQAHLEQNGALSLVAHATAAFAHVPTCVLRVVPIAEGVDPAASLLVRVNEPDPPAAARTRPLDDAALESYLDQLDIGIFTLALEGQTLEVNATMCAMLGYSRAEFLAREAFSITHADDRAEDVANGIRALAGDIDHWICERQLIRSDGSLLWVLGSVALVRGDHGEPLHFVCHATDLTTQKARESQLRGMLAGRPPAGG
jgi:PAS domain S-box-containing protein